MVDCWWISGGSGRSVVDSGGFLVDSQLWWIAGGLLVDCWWIWWICGGFWWISGGFSIMVDFGGSGGHVVDCGGFLVDFWICDGL